MMSAAHRTIRGPDPRRASVALAAFAAVGVIALASGLFDVLSFPHVPYLLFFVGAMILVLRERSPISHKSRRGSRALPDQMPTQRAISNPKATRVVVGLFVLIASFALILLGRPSGASAAEVSCPNANPIVNENNCMGEGTTANQSAVENYSEDLGGFTPQTSYNLGENVPLKIGTDLPSFPAHERQHRRLPDRLVRRRRRAPDRRARARATSKSTTPFSATREHRPPGN